MRHNPVRRQITALCAAASAGLMPGRLRAQSAVLARLALDAHAVGPLVPEDFIGLSYEVQQLQDASFFSAANRQLIGQFRALAPRGVLRLGGNTSDRGWWKADAGARPPSPGPHAGHGEAPDPKLAFAIEPGAIAQLRGFLDATDWTCLFGINLGTNTVGLAVDQARHVAQVLGPRLAYFQLGNEPDLYTRHLRDPARWHADAYFDEWLRMAEAISQAVPAARFGLPDTAGHPEWSATVTARWQTLAASGPAPRIAALTHHYYFGGPPANPDVNIDRLLQPDPGVRNTAAAMREAARPLGVVLRMTEGNTCYLGGKPGVSDVLASALWAADYLLTLAGLGYAGVNLHGGGGREVANSLGGTLPGELLMADPQQPHPRPFYTPIAAMADGYVLQPVGVGMQFAGHFAGASMLGLHFDPGSVNATAHAARAADGTQLLAIVNKDAQRDLLLDLPGWSVRAELTGDGLLAPTAQLNRSRPSGPAGPGAAPFRVPHASAVLFSGGLGPPR